MNPRVRQLLDRIAALEQELAVELHSQAERFQYRVTGRHVAFNEAVAAAQRRLRMSLGRWLLESRPRSWLSVPFIYGMIVPLLLLDVCLGLYQLVCFPLYGIPRVRRRDYFVLDHHRLPYLNPIEKLHCGYCSYANGLLAYARELTARTEQYWCPIKHARPVRGAHDRYASFLDFGDPTDFHARVQQQRLALAQEAAPPAPSAGTRPAPGS
jgi:hypothetical protein